MNAGIAKKREASKSFVKENKATIVCPSCNIAKTLSVEVFKEKTHHIKVQCSCGYPFAVDLEFRKAFRKPTSLMGYYELHTQYGIESGRAKLQDLSLQGVSFDVRNIHHEIEPGVKGSLRLTLDDRKQSKLVRGVVVRSVRQSVIGCEFNDDNASKELGFYMLSL